MNVSRIFRHLKKMYMAHEYHKPNNVANRLAKWAVKYNVVAKWMEGHDFPSEINDLIERDCIPGRLGIINSHNERYSYVGYCLYLHV